MKVEDKMVGWEGFGVVAGQKNSCSKYGWFTYYICIRVRGNGNSEFRYIFINFKLRPQRLLIQVADNQLFQVERGQETLIFVTLVRG